MLFIAHRINTAAQLQQIPHEYGVEIDLRDTVDERLILQHDPFKDGEDFDDWLAHYNHAFLILNIKTEGIEWKVIEKMQAHKITEYMFLDCSIPMIMKLIAKGEYNIAIRYSEVEPIELAQQFIGKAKWLWVDCFTSYPNLQHPICKQFKICLVSPSLQGRNDEIAESKEHIDAVCEKIYNKKRWLKE